MDDSKYELLKEFCSMFPDAETFESQYLDPHGFKGEKKKAILQLYDAAKGTQESWDMFKFMSSSDSIRMSKLIPTEEFTVSKTLDVLKTYDLSKYKRILLKLENKDYEGLDKLKDLGPDVLIEVVGDAGFCTIDDFIKMREFFNTFKETYHPETLSELEKITLAYDHCKFFQYTEEKTENKTESRSIAKIISRGDIVCLGYSRIFCELLREMDIKSFIMHVYETDPEVDGHARVIVNIQDNKYNVNDKYMFDPTWDSYQDISLVENINGDVVYKLGNRIKEDDKVLERYPSSIMYNLYMIPTGEFKKYFSKEKIEDLEIYPSHKRIQISNELLESFKDDDLKPKNKEALRVLPDVLKVVKTIEGYNQEEINNYINSALDIMQSYRYGILDSNAPKL